MAVDFLDWGSVEYSDVKIGRYPVMENGRRLFLIRNGEPEFPQEDFRKWFPVGAGFAGIGRLNTNTIAFEVGLHKALASADAHKFKAIVTLRIKIADQPAAWREAVMAHADLEPRIRSMVERVANETFAAHGYRDIYYAIPDVSKPFSLSLADRIESVSPYRLVSTGYEVEAIDASVDAAIKAAQREIALEAERERNEAIARDRVERERANELANFEHDDDLAKRRSKAKREEEAEAARLRIQLEEEAQNARIRAMKATAEAVPDIEMLIALADPKAAAEIRKANITKGFELGRAQGLVEGVKGALRLQDLNPITDTTVRIVHEPVRDHQEDAAQDAPE